MKTYNKPATSKLVARFDSELKQLLMEDLKVFRAKNNQRNNQPVLQQQAAWSIYTSTYKKSIYLSYENDEALPYRRALFLFNAHSCSFFHTLAMCS